MNKICNLQDWNNPIILKWINLLYPNNKLISNNKVIRIHRKDWEFAISLATMEKYKFLNSGFKALGVGSGHERILYLLTKYIAKVVATDLYGETLFSDNESNPDVLINKNMYAPFAYDEDKLNFYNMDALNLEFEDDSFDIVFSYSSIEHFGGINKAIDSINEMKRVCKPGGLITIASEYITPYGEQFHSEFFTQKQIEENFLNLNGIELIDAFDWRCDIEQINMLYPTIWERLKRKLYNIFNKYPQYPYIQITDGKCIWTSFHMAFIKNI